MHDTGDALAEAIAGCARRDLAALRRVFDAEAPRLTAIALRILRSQALAEEAVQDALVQVWTRAETYRPERGHPRAWLTAIVRNRALTILRAEARTATAEDVDQLPERAEVDEAAQVLRRLDPTLRLAQCLQALDHAKRTSIVLAYVYGLSQGEIAGRSGVPLGTVKGWMRRGLSALRACMG